MPSLNKCFLMGNVTRDIDMRYTASGTAVANFGLAVNRKYKLASGEDGEDTLFIDCAAWGKSAEVLKEYVGKGDPLFVEGRLQLDEWDDKENPGRKRQKIKLTVENFQFLRMRGDAATDGAGRTTDSDQDQDEDIPF